MARLCPPGKVRRALDLLETDFEGGLQTLEDLASSYAKDPDVRAALGMAYMDDGRVFEALPHLEWAARKDPSPDLQDALFATYRALAMPVHALRLAGRSAHLARAASVDAERTRTDAAADDALSLQDRLAFERGRTGVMHGDRKAANELQRLATKHPDYQPVRNLLVTDRLLKGDLEGFVALAERTFSSAPGDPHALLNATRAAFVRGGFDAARDLRPHAEALVPDPGWAGDRYLARAGAFALMDDADAAEAALTAYHDWVQETGDDGQPALADALDDLLERRHHDASAPLVDLHELMVGLVERWKSMSEEQIEASIEAALASVPGLLRELPDLIGYQAPATLRLLAMLVLHDVAPPPPHGTWVAVLRRVVTQGPGTRQARRMLLMLLAETGHIDHEAVVLRSDDDDDDDDAADVLLRRLQLSGEAVPSGLPPDDDARMSAALDELQAGRTASALKALSALHQCYPDSLPLTHNLALAERLSGGDVALAGHERLERLVARHPDYIFARAELAVTAIEAGDLVRAEALLALPDGKRRVHVLEWGAFAAASGRLALARGDVDAAEALLDGIGDTLGSEAAAYRALDAAVDRYLDDLGPVAAADFDDEFDDDTVVYDDADDDTDDDVAAFDDAADDDDVSLTEVPDRDELMEMPTLDEHWCIALRPTVFMIGEDPEPTLTWLGAVATDAGFVRLVNVEAEDVDADSLYALVARACAGGMVAAEPGRPKLVRLGDPDRASELAELLAPFDIDVVVGDTEPALAGVRSLAEALGGGVPSWLADAEDEHVAAFFDAVDAFYDATPWLHFPSDGYVAFRIGDGPWRYANVMGQGGEEFGLAVFASWHAANLAGQGATVDLDAPDDQDDDAMRLEAIGSFEGLSLAPLAALSPLDAGRYLVADYEPDVDATVPAWLRFEAGGAARPEHEPGVYAALISLLAEHAGRTRHHVRRIDAAVDTPAGTMRVRYPATGDEPSDEPVTPRVRA